ncbi:MAG: ubiquinol-cytochrome c reductase iron-sulfur subunit [candidate division KSB1 bacterium]|nr:ubiquinol-cytochrome c reductase iron-sulfur subunit [candidate division KSB1 bacterium]
MADHPPDEGRRGFLRLLVGGWIASLAGAIAYPILRYILPPPVSEPSGGAVNAGKLAELPPNSGRVIRLGSMPAILIRVPTGEVRAFSAVCTHLQCTVQYRSDIGHIWCACHNGHYDLEGRNISGPPPKPLERLEVRVDNDGNILVARKAGTA